MTGVPRKAIYTFLKEWLSSEVIAKYEKALDSACTRVLSLVQNNLHQAVEEVVFRLSEMRGLARWKDRYESIGLDAPVVNAVLDNAGGLLMKVEEVRRTMTEVSRNYKCFFKWLGINVAALSDEQQEPIRTGPIQTEYIAECLEKDLLRNRFGQFFSRTPLEFNSTVEPDVCIPDFQDKWESQARVSFAGQLKALQDSWELLSDRPFRTISPLVAAFPSSPPEENPLASITSILPALSRLTTLPLSPQAIHREFHLPPTTICKQKLPSSLPTPYPATLTKDHQSIVQDWISDCQRTTAVHCVRGTNLPTHTAQHTVDGDGGFEGAGTFVAVSDTCSRVIQILFLPQIPYSSMSLSSTPYPYLRACVDLSAVSQDGYIANLSFYNNTHLAVLLRTQPASSAEKEAGSAGSDVSMGDSESSSTCKSYSKLLMIDYTRGKLVSNRRIQPQKKRHKKKNQSEQAK